MAKRPFFLWTQSGNNLCIEKNSSFIWNPGFSVTQKRKNIHALHESARELGFFPLLEVSTKSEYKLGQRLSAFNLKTPSPIGDIPVECAYQGSKVFELGGPFTDLYDKPPREAKKDARLVSSGKLTHFEYFNTYWSLYPQTAFYDWLIFQSLRPHADYLERLLRFSGFTDIEFNPEKSVSCQARTCAIISSLIYRKTFAQISTDSKVFIQFYKNACVESQSKRVANTLL